MIQKKGPGRPKGKRSAFYNRNHFIRSAHGKRKAGNTRRKRRIQRRPNRGYKNLSKVYQVTPELEKIINLKEASRPQVVKGIWAYIKEHKLQSAKDGRMIIPNQDLATVIGKEGEVMNAYLMLRYINRHLVEKKEEPKAEANAPQ